MEKYGKPDDRQSTNTENYSIIDTIPKTSIGLMLDDIEEIFCLCKSIPDGILLNGYRIPTEKSATKRIITLQDIQEETEENTYPNQIKAWLEHFAKCRDMTMHFPHAWDDLQKGTIADKSFEAELNTQSNRKIMDTLRDLFGYDTIIPIGKDNGKRHNGYVKNIESPRAIYLSLKKGGSHFFTRHQHDSNFLCTDLSKS